MALASQPSNQSLVMRRMTVELFTSPVVVANVAVSRRVPRRHQEPMLLARGGRQYRPSAAGETLGTFITVLLMRCSSVLKARERTRASCALSTSHLSGTIRLLGIGKH